MSEVPLYNGKYPSGRVAAVTRKIGQIKDLMQDNNNLTNEKDIVLNLIEELYDKIKVFREACEQFIVNTESAEEVNTFSVWRDKHIETFEAFVAEVTSKFSPEKEIAPHDSVSQAEKSRTSIRSKSSIKLDLSIRKLESEAKRRATEEKLKLEKEEMKMKQEFELRQFKIKEKMALMDSKVESELLKELEEKLSIVNEKRSSVRSKISVEPRETKPRSISSEPTRLQAMHVQLPVNEPDYFSGEDITLYRTFLLAFERMIVSKCTSTDDKFYYLLKYTSGEAKRYVQSCLGEDIEQSYREARKLLDERYGSNYLIAHKYLEKLSNWQPIRSEDAKGLGELASFLIQCNNMMSKMSELNQLNSWRDIKEILNKLPYDLRKQFRTKACCLVKRNEEVNFNTLVQFVNDQSEILNFPMIGDLNDITKFDRERKPFDRRDKTVKQRSFYSQFEKLKCSCCRKENHSLDNCFFFMKKSLKDREDFVKTKNLCFGCLKTDKHKTRECSDKIQCKTCGKLHPNSLHRKTVENHDKTLDKTSNESNETNLFVKTKRIAFPSIPIILKSKDGKLKFKTYMGLDNFSSSSYMDMELVNKLNLKGSKTKLKIKTIDNSLTEVNATVINNIEITSLDESRAIVVPKLYAKENWPFKFEDSPKISDVKNRPELSNVPFQFIESKIGILIGMDMPEIMRPLKVVQSKINGPYASKHLLGWALNGPVEGICDNSKCYRTKIEEIEDLNTKFNDLFAQDFVSDNVTSRYSNSDMNWLKKVSDSTTKLENNCFEIKLPFIEENVNLPNNYSQVKGRLSTLINKFKKNKEYFDEYNKLMTVMLENDFIEKVPNEDLNVAEGKLWYLAHHGVRHKQKGKLRIVFDCSLRYKGVCLNDKLQKGPDLANSLIGVLLRFRLGKIAVSGDIEKMFYMIKLPKSDSNFLRFLWFDDNDFSAPPVSYRLKVHVFGASSSPAIANFALKNSVQNEENEETKSIVLESFYVDDMLKSFDDEESAVRHVDHVRKVLLDSGFNLTGFASNSRYVLDSIPVDKLSKTFDSIDITEELPSDRALGIKWNTENDTLGYKVNIPENPATKRGILSSIFSLYDPLFLASPVTIRAKRIFQIACDKKLEWDEELPHELKKIWNKWKNDVNILEEFAVPRWYGSDCSSNNELHIFCDGSEIAYGAVAYLRTEHCNSVTNTIVMAKTRLTPLNRSSLKTVPRIELNAAKLAVNLYGTLNEELSSHIDINSVTFWTDSVAVLHYLNSESSRFQRFVSNRIAFILSNTSPDRWRFIPGELNPADLLSRGTTNVTDFINDKSWTQGPAFLALSRDDWPVRKLPKVTENEDCEVKLKQFSLYTNEVSDANISEKEKTLAKLFTCSNSHKLKLRIVIFMKFVSFIKDKYVNPTITVDDLKTAETKLWKYHQKIKFDEILNTLKTKSDLPRKSPIAKLIPFLDDTGLIRIGGRLSKAPIPFDAKHPVLLHGSDNLVTLLIKREHEMAGHLGKESILSRLRQRFHIVKGNPTIKKVLRSCVTCRKVQGKVGNQIMSDLPEDRLTGGNPPFYYTATDLFGPFYVSVGRGRAQQKRYGIIFTCLTSRAAHIELAYSLDTDSYINALRRFICRRGCPKIMRSDNGTNLTSANRELKEATDQWSSLKINQFCLRKEIEWRFQPPHASHFGGVFEREIRTIRKILNSLLREFENQTKLTDELLCTLFCEIEDILNNRPLTVVSTDPLDLDPITPNHILRLQSDEPASYTQTSHDELNFCPRKQWKRVQHLANKFWYRWRREYVPLLIARQKWLNIQRSHAPGDIVLVVDQLLPRNMWSLGRIVSVDKDSYGPVRSCTVEVTRYKQDGQIKIKKTQLRRPVNKLVLVNAVENLNN